MGKKLLPEGKLEYKARTAQQADFWPLEGLIEKVKSLFGTLIPSAQRLVWAAKQPLGNAALGALFA